jgi:hypothetical protein
MNALLKMEDFVYQLQRKPEPSELVKESVVETQRQAMLKHGLVAFRKRPPAAVFKPPFAASTGNVDVVSEKEKRRHDLCRCAMKSVT